MTVRPERLASLRRPRCVEPRLLSDEHEGSVAHAAVPNHTLVRDHLLDRAAEVCEAEGVDSVVIEIPPGTEGQNLWPVRVDCDEL